MNLTIASRVGLILGAFILLGVGVVGYVLTQDSSRVLRDKALLELDASLRQGERNLSLIVDGGVRDLRLLSRSREIRQFMATADFDRDHLQELFESMLLKQPWYARVRLIAAAGSGAELARVERMGSGNARQVPPSELRDKGQRRYFVEALQLPAGQVYLSRINLSRESDGSSESPQPLLRVMTPLHSTTGSAVVGLLVIDIDMGMVFERLSADLARGNRLLVANAQGEYLLHPRPHLAFAFERGESFRLADTFPDLDRRLASGGLVHVDSNTEDADGMQPQLLAFTRLPMPDNSAEQYLTLGVSEPLARIEAEIRAMLERGFLITGLLGVMAAVVAWFLAWQLVRPLRAVTLAVEAFRVGKGFSGPLPVDRHDEIGQLARSVQDMDQRIQTQMRWLEEQHGRLDSLIETAADAIVLIDRNGIMERCNSAVTHLFGYSKEELDGNNVNMLMNPTDARRHDDYLLNYMRTGEGRIIGIGREVTGRHKDGRPLPLYLSIGEFEVNGEPHFTGILHDMSRRLALEEELRHQANTDALTGVFNRRYFIEQLEREMTRAARYQAPLSLMVIDLDHFKQINDRHGHSAGDQALNRAVSLLAEQLRSADVLARFGGDEFVVLLPETELETAHGVGQRLCDRAADTEVIEGGSERLSFSIGVAQFSGEEDLSELLRRVDDALYRAKDRGRGRVESGGADQA